MTACRRVLPGRCHHVRVVSRLPPSRLLLLLVVWCALGAACSSGGGDRSGASPSSVEPAVTGGEVFTVATLPSGPARGGELTILLEDDPPPIVGWTPWDHVCAWACRNVLDQVLETLAVLLPDGTVAPWLAESITPDDTLTEWTVIVREGIDFSDGQPMTATRIWEAHEEFFKDGKATEGLLRDAHVVGVQAPDDRTLIYQLNEPNAGFPSILAGPVGRVFSIEAARTDPASFLRAPVGTGPFVFESWEVGSDAVLGANATYWREDAVGEPLPRVDRLTFVQVADEDERLDRLRRGDAQILQTRVSGVVQRARQLQLTVISRIEDNVGVIVFNTLEPPFDDSRVRRALLLASDQEALLAASAAADVTLAGTQWWGPESVWYSQRVADNWPSTDIEAAQLLLSEYQNDELRTDGREVGEAIAVVVQCTDDLELSNMARTLAAQWEATGLIDAEVEVVSRSGLIQRVTGAITDRPSFSGQFTATCWRMGGESDPWTLLSTALGPVKTSPLNISNLQDEGLSDLLTLVQESRTFATRRAAVEQIMMSFAIEVPALYLGYATSAVVGSNEVEGLGAWTLPTGQQVFGQVGGVGHYAEVWRR